MSGPEQSPAAEARKRFPSPEPPDTYLREAFLAIASAHGASAFASELLEQLRGIARSDPEELEDSLGGETFIEIDLRVAAERLEAAFRECRVAARSLRRTRGRRPKPPRKLRVVS